MTPKARRELVMRLANAGFSYQEIAKQAGVGVRQVGRLVRQETERIRAATGMDSTSVPDRVEDYLAHAATPTTATEALRLLEVEAKLRERTPSKLPELKVVFEHTGKGPRTLNQLSRWIVVMAADLRRSYADIVAEVARLEPVRPSEAEAVEPVSFDALLDEVDKVRREE